MKNIKIIIPLILVVLLTACSSNKLKCTIKNNELNSKYVITYKDNKLSSLSFKEKKIYNSLDATIDLDYYELVNKYQELDSKNINYDIKENKNDITIKINAEEGSYKNNNILSIKEDTTMDEARSILTALGYVCK